MKNKLAITFLLIFSVNTFADEIVCMGNSNDNQLIQIAFKLDPRTGTVEVDGSKINLSIANDFIYVWQNSVGNQAYTNTLSRIDGSLTVVAENVLIDEKPQPLLRAALACKNKKDLLF